MRYRIEETVLGVSISLVTDDRCFSPRSADSGTLAMLSICPPASGEKILDLGCGYGLVGVVCASIAGQDGVFMSDSDPVAVALAEENIMINRVPRARVILSDGFKDIGETGFDLILCNPPYHANFSVPKHFIEKGFNRLKIGGRMAFVTKRLDWYKRKFISVFGGVMIRAEGGYFIFTSIRTQSGYAGASNRTPR